MVWTFILHNTIDHPIDHTHGHLRIDKRFVPIRLVFSPIFLPIIESEILHIVLQLFRSVLCHYLTRFKQHQRGFLVNGLIHPPNDSFLYSLYSMFQNMGH